MTFENDYLIDRKTVAKLLHIKPGTLATWEWRKKPILKPVKIGRMVRYRRSDVDDLIRKTLS